MMAGGVLAGASSPYHALASYPGSPDSAMVGISGRPDARFALVTPSARSRRVCTCGMAEGPVGNESDTWPAMRSVIACALPLYGTCTILMPAIDLKSSAARWGGVPLPADA